MFFYSLQNQEKRYERPPPGVIVYDAWLFASSTNLIVLPLKPLLCLILNIVFLFSQQNKFDHIVGLGGMAKISNHSI